MRWSLSVNSLAEGVPANHALLTIMNDLIGKEVLVEAIDGNKYSGIFAACSTEFDIGLRYAHEITVANKKNLLPKRSDIIEKLQFKFGDIVAMSALMSEEKVIKGFATDRDYHSKQQNGRLGDGLELQEWEGDDESEDNESTDQQMVDITCRLYSWKPDFMKHLAGDITKFQPDQRQRYQRNGGWSVDDMFSANSQLGVQSTFDEDLRQYTTADVEGSEEDRRRADIIAKEIEGNAQSKFHARLENDDDERDLDKTTTEDDFELQGRRSQRGNFNNRNGRSSGGSTVTNRRAEGLKGMDQWTTSKDCATTGRKDQGGPGVKIYENTNFNKSQKGKIRRYFLICYFVTEYILQYQLLDVWITFESGIKSSIIIIEAHVAILHLMKPSAKKFSFNPNAPAFTPRIAPTTPTPQQSSAPPQTPQSVMGGVPIGPVPTEVPIQSGMPPPGMIPAMQAGQPTAVMMPWQGAPAQAYQVPGGYQYVVGGQPVNVMASQPMPIGGPRPGAAPAVAFAQGNPRRPGAVMVPHSAAQWQPQMMQVGQGMVPYAYQSFQVQGAGAAVPPPQQFGGPQQQMVAGAQHQQPAPPVYQQRAFLPAQVGYVLPQSGVPGQTRFPTPQQTPHPGIDSSHYQAASTGPNSQPPTPGPQPVPSPAQGGGRTQSPAPQPGPPPAQQFMAPTGQPTHHMAHPQHFYAQPVRSLS
uniref:LsmAD domain-containing protein n=1 Tax=Heterorhabditis bacteriophora TaxID=37862 RepID=A0A1I7XSU1_HETBA